MTTTTVSPTTGAGSRPPASAERDRYVDLLRAGSLLVVVLWHWVFTVLLWRPDGPHASNPIGSTPWLWLATWVLQVMPLFFFVGGFAHLRTFESTERAGEGTGAFLRRRLGRLVVPTLALLAAAGAAWFIADALFPDARWVGRGLLLLVSPLWFLGVYLVLVLLTPLAVRLHRTLGAGALAALAAVAVVVDVLRLGAEVPYVEWVNFVLVYGFAHQLGFWWPSLVAAGRRRAGALLAAGAGGLILLTAAAGYPRSMVGVPGDPISNVAPPTVCLLALALLQVGLVLLVRPRAERWLAAGRADRLLAWANGNAMTVFLWHFSGYAVFLGLFTLAGGSLPEDADLGWWQQRPLWLVGPALCTVPLLRTFRRLERR
jgi:peptidoglycan/LPS O-acetylase OafA/YrhL